jgi:excisionase family DNA binding protein
VVFRAAYGSGHRAEFLRSREFPVPGKLMTFEDVAEALSTSIKHVRRLAARDDDPLPSFLLGGKRRVRPDDLNEWVNREAGRGPDAA